MFETFYILLLLCVAAAFVERIFSKRDFSTKTLFMLIGGLFIGMGVTFHVKEISDSGYQKVYQYVVYDSSNEQKLRVAQDALVDNKITLKEMQAIMPASSFGPIPSESQYMIQGNFKVLGLPEITPLQTTAQFKWAIGLYKANYVFGLLLVFAALISLISFIASGTVHKYLNPIPVLFSAQFKFILSFLTLSILTTAIMYGYPASSASVKSVQAFVNNNKAIESIQQLNLKSRPNQTMNLHDLYLFSTIADKVHTAQIKKIIPMEK